MLQIRQIFIIAVITISGLIVTTSVLAQDDTGNGVECPEKETSDFDFNSWNTTYRLATYHGLCTDWIPWSNSGIARIIPSSEFNEDEDASIEIENGSKSKVKNGKFAYDSKNKEWRFLGNGSNNDFWDNSIGTAQPGRWDYGFSTYDYYGN